MESLEELRPKGKPTIMSLLDALGFDVQGWHTGAGGKPYKNPAANPKYCYEWVHVDKGKVALNLWLKDIKPGPNAFTYIINPAKLQKDYEQNATTRPGKLATVVMRAQRTHQALKDAADSGLSIYAIISDGHRREPSDPFEVKSKVKARAADGLSWRVSSYNPKSGEFRLVRGAQDSAKGLATQVPTSKETVLVLAENEENASKAHEWRDVTGVRYHFPNNYKNLIRPGVRFIYYKGRRRSSGGSGQPEYFGHGVIGDVYADPDTATDKPSNRKWIAEIADYVPLVTAVPLRQADGVYSELLSASAVKNRWGVGVRRIDEAAYLAILNWGGIPPAPPAGLPFQPSGPAALTDLPAVWKAQKKSEGGNTRSGFDFKRLSPRAKAIGDEAERIALAWLRNQEADPALREKIRWVAQAGETPGYDIEDGRTTPVMAFEVKGTQASQFVSIELTANELECAKRMRKRFALMLVAGVFTKSPKVVLLTDPATALDESKLSATPTVFRIELIA